MDGALGHSLLFAVALFRYGLFFYYYTHPQLREQSIVICESVCLSIAHIQEPHTRTSPNFLCMVLAFMSQSFSGSITIGYVTSSFEDDAMFSLTRPSVTGNTVGYKLSDSLDCSMDLIL